MADLLKLVSYLSAPDFFPEQRPLLKVASSRNRVSSLFPLSKSAEGVLLAEAHEKAGAVDFILPHTFAIFFQKTFESFNAFEHNCERLSISPEELVRTLRV